MNLQGIKNRIRKILAYTVTAILFLLISSFLVLQMPPVQNYLVSKYMKSLTQVTGFNSSITTFRMLWFDRLELLDLNVYDPDHNKMISAKKILINFRLTQLFNSEDIDIDGLYVDGAQVLLTDVNASDSSRYLNLNVFIDRISAQYASADTLRSGKSVKINIGEATVEKSSFIYIDQKEDSIKEGFDYFHFALDVDEGQLEKFVIQGDTTEFKVNTLILKDRQTQFSVSQLSTFFRVCQTSMEFNDIHLKAGQSTVGDTVVFGYKNMNDLSDFVDKVTIKANLKDCIIEPKDLAVFAPGVQHLGQVVTLNGNMNGRVDKFKYSNMDIGIGKTKLQGSLTMEGLPDIYETFIVLNLKNSTLSFPDLEFMMGASTVAQFTPLGMVSLQGQFLGYPNDFVAKASIGSKLGHIASDINLKIKEGDFYQSVYSGRLALANFKLGTYLNDTATYQNITMDGSIKGSGLKSSTADFILNGRISSIGINKYNYTNIITDARFATEFFSGALTINDPNLKFKAKGSIDMRQQKNRIQLQASLDTALLHNLNITNEKISLRSDVDFNITGLTLDSLVGDADLRNFRITYNDKALSLKDIHLHSGKQNLQRSINLETTLVDASLTGNFLFSDISIDLKNLFDEILLNVKNDEQEIKSYYQNKNDHPKEYETKFAVRLKDIHPLTDLINVDLHVSKDILIDGNFSSGITTIFKIYTTIDSIHYNGSDFYHTDIELTTSKISDSTSVLAMAYVNSRHQIFGPNFKTKNLSVEGIWNNSHIDFGVDVDQDGQDNFMRLKGDVDFLKDSTQIKFQPSTLKILDQNWSFEPDNLMLMANREWGIRNVTLVSAGQSIGINGNLSVDPEKKLYFNINKLNLSILNAITGLKFRGTLNAQTNLNDYYNNPTVENNIQVDSLTISDFLIGDVTGKNEWNASEKRFNVNFFIERLQKRTVNIDGYYDPLNEKSPLNLTAKLENANLKIIEPFLSEIFSQWGGTISGLYIIKGLPGEPEFTGDGKVIDGQVMINYLKTQYHFMGDVGLTKNSIELRQFELIDGLRNKAKLTGSIQHTNFSDTYINIRTTFQNFQVLNTSIKDNSLFYGQAYATGRVSFTGPVSNLKVSASARSEKNTRIYIPIGGTSSIEKKDFISFVNFNDSTFIKNLKKELSNKIDLSGLSLDLNLDITPDAYCEIILDIKSGDIIRGRGNGDLQLQLDTKGDFNMFGFFEFTEGWYNFTLYDIINKEFQIQKGSRIAWYGDPYAGVLNINASYNQLASFGPILSDPTKANDTMLRRKYPAQVLLKLDGPMLSPTINFDITAKDLPQQNIILSDGVTSVSLPLEFNAFKSKLDEQELKRQVFSLIILRRFSAINAALNTSGSLANSVSELFSNQLSNWMTQVDQNLEINVDLGRFDQEAFNTFQLRLSYTFLNGRLRITRDGTFNNSNQTTANTNSTNVSNITGDWTVEYQLTADGKFKVKMYNRTNVNPIINTGTPTTFTTGASLFYTQSFNQLSDLWKKARNKRQAEEAEALQNKEAIKEKTLEDGTE